MKLRIASDLALPLDAIAARIAILAVSGAGKTYTALKLVEQVFRAQLPTVVIDPSSVCWGLRASADGKGPGLPITIFGGEHGDVPLEPTAGEIIADFIVETNASAVLDVADWSKGEQVRFMTAFGERLFLRKNPQSRRTPLFMVMDEADEFAPQRPMKGEERCLGAWERIVRRGRARGLFPLLVSQRAAVLNKNVLTQCQVLIAQRTTGVQDIEALEEWMRRQGATAEQREVFLTESARLPDGEGYVWWPRGGIFKRVRIAPRETFDSSKTPKMGERPIEPKVLAEVDLEELKKRIAGTIERAKAEDPKELRREISRLRGENVRLQTQQPFAEIQRVEVPVLDEATVKRLEAALLEAEGFADALRRVAGQVIEGTAQAQRALDAARQVRPMASMVGAGRSRAAPKADVPERRAGSSPATSTSQLKELGKGEFRVLTAVAQHPEGVTREQVTILTGYKRSTRDTYLRRLRAAGFVVVGERIEATAEGRAALGRGFEPLPVGDALREHWIGRLPEGERRILQMVLDAYPRAVERERISELTGYARSSRDTYLQRLRARRLVETDRGAVRAADDLFDLQRSAR